jgi:hypothetical protein
MKKLFAILIGCILTHSLQAEIYKWVDGSGIVHFSDKPQSGAETITLPPTQTYSPPKAANPVTPQQEQENSAPIDQQSVSTYTKVMIIQPQDQETLRSNQGLLTVVTRVEPDLEKTDRLQVLYDGNLVGKPQKELSFSLNNVYRGAHTLQVQVVSEDGHILGASSPITVYMHHTRVGGGN